MQSSGGKRAGAERYENEMQKADVARRAAAASVSGRHKARPHLRALALTACAALAACSPHEGASSNLPQDTLAPVRPERSGAPGRYISHVVIVVQENRTLENFFVGYPGANAPLYGYGKDPKGHVIKIPLKQITFDSPTNITHLWQAGIDDWDGGKMDGFNGFGVGGRRAAYAYVERSQVAPYWQMAQQNVLADEMFPTEFGPSFTAHLTLVAGTDNITQDQAEVDFPDHAPNDCDSPPGTMSSVVNAERIESRHGGPFPCFTQFNTMAETLDAAGVSWRYYVTQLQNAGIWSAFEAIDYVRHGPDWKTDIAAPQTRILSDVRDGHLASVSWVTPSKADSDHPGTRSDTGPSWVASIVNAIGASEYWNSTAIVVVWDDWGGWYDNAPPPQPDFRGLGIRVPCLIVSPYAKRGYVSHTQYEFGSILKFVEQIFGLPPLGSQADGYTDTRANSIIDSFDFTQSPRAFQAIRAKYPASHFLSERPSTDPVDEY